MHHEPVTPALIAAMTAYADALAQLEVPTCLTAGTRAMS